jgi:hypothetical protein
MQIFNERTFLTAPIFDTMKKARSNWKRSVFFYSIIFIYIKFVRKILIAAITVIKKSILPGKQTSETIQA